MAGGYFALALAALAFCADGVATQALGLALPALIADWHQPRAAFASPTALGLVGFALGAFGGGLAGDRFGPVRAMLGALLVMGLATAGCGLAHSVAELSAWRVLAGLGLGASLPIAASVIAQRAPEHQRSVALAVGLAFLPIGGFLVGLAAAAILPVYGWRGLFSACGALAVALSLLGAAALRPQSAVGRAQSEVEDQALQRAASREPVRGSLLALGVGARDTLGLGIAFFFTVLLYYSIFSWAPTALSSSGLAVPVVSRTLSVFSAGGLIGGVLAGFVVQRFGSRVCLAVLGGAAIVCALALPGALAGAAHGGIGPLRVAIGLLGVSVIGVQTLLYAVGAHVYPVAHRTFGLGVAVGCGRLGAIASSYTGVLSLDLGGARGFCGALAVAGLATVVAGLAISRQIGARGVRQET